MKTLQRNKRPTSYVCTHHKGRCLQASIAARLRGLTVPRIVAWGPCPPWPELKLLRASRAHIASSISPSSACKSVARISSGPAAAAARFNRSLCTMASAAAPDAAARQGSPETRLVWEISRQGSLSHLQQVSAPVPLLQPGQALVAVRAIGLNFADVFCCLGLYKAAPKGAFVPGLEFAGEVIAVGAPAVAPATPPAAAAATDPRPGPAASRTCTGAATAADSSNVPSAAPASGAHSAPVMPSLQPGDRVLGVTRFGAFTTHVCLDTAYLRRFPDSWSYEEAAAFAVQTLTAAYGLLNCGGLRKGDSVLVQSAAGGVGLQALQICHKLDCTVLGLVGSPSKVQLLQQQFTGSNALSTAAAEKAEPASTPSSISHGSQANNSAGGGSSSSSGGAMQFAVRQSNPADIQQQLSRFLVTHNKPGLQIVLDAVAGPYFQPSYDALQPTGRYVLFGAAALTPPLAPRYSWGGGCYG